MARQSYKWGYRQGGLMHCCIETLHKHNSPGLFDGQQIKCLYCSSKMRWVESVHAWEWEPKGEFSGQTAIEMGGDRDGT